MLEGDNISTLTATFSRVMRISTGIDGTTASSIEQSAMTSERGSSCGSVANVNL